MTAPTVLRRRAELAELPAVGRRAVVMTMGALHDGHLDLVRRAQQIADQVLVTVFVNPLQFGPGEDLDAYPRDLERDLAALEPLDVAAVFAPSAAEMYPGGVPIVSIDPGPLGTIWEGAIRPGHFGGVLTVVHKLACLTRADIALFGQKDAQQVAVVRAMVRDLDLPVEIEVVPVRRADDGLALSSRNAYLSSRERDHALVLSRALAEAQACARAGGAAADTFNAAARLVSGAPGLELDYLALVDPRDFAPLASDLVCVGRRAPAGLVPPAHGAREPRDENGANQGVLIVAARLGTTRLLDNTPLRFNR